MERADLEQWKAREVARLLALVETERRYYQEIVASVPVGLLVLAADLSIVSSNREVRNIFGLRGGDPIRGRLDSLLPATVLDQVREVIETGKPVSGIYAQARQDGEKNVRISIQRMRNWHDEAEQEALITIEDCSGAPQTQPQAAATTALRPEKGTLAAAELLDNLDAIVWAVDLPSKQFLYVNDKAQQLLGYPTDRWLNVPGFWGERIYSEDRDRILKSYDRAIENRIRQSCEYRAQTSYGRIVWLHETARLLLNEDGQSKHLIGIAVDVTQRRLLEDQAIQSQRVDAIGKLGTRVSYEIHNLLMVVSGYGEELLQGLPASHPLHSDLQEILSATDRLRGLANHLSLFSRRPPAAAAPLDLGAFMTKIEPDLRSTLGDKIQLDMKMLPAPIGVQVDAAQLEQLVCALAHRASREMASGGKLTIQWSPVEITEDLGGTGSLRTGVYAVIRIEDTGPTLDPDARAALFESIPAARETKDDSAVLLSRLYPAVKQWGGDISVSINSPQGNVFEIFLPRPGESSSVGAASQPSVEGAPQSAPEPVVETILMAEEDTAIRALVKKILRRKDYAVLEAGTSDEAMKAAEEHGGKINLLITDVSGAQLDGGKLAQRLQALHPEMRVLYLSGYKDDPDAQASGTSSGAPFLQKPFTLGSLLNKVREVLGNQPE